jgi:hypothetical protein
MNETTMNETTMKDSTVTTRGAALASASARARAEALRTLRVSLASARRDLDDALANAPGVIDARRARFAVPHEEAVVHARGMVAAVRLACLTVRRVETPKEAGHVPPSEAARAALATLDACAAPALAYAETDDGEAGRAALRTVAREAEACAKALRAALGSDGA